MKPTLVTGGTGFLGRHVVARLAAMGRQVRVLAREGSDVAGLADTEIVRGDVTREEDLRRALQGVGRVLHLAAEVRDDQPAEAYAAVNLRAVEMLLELAPQLGVERVVHTSSYFAIGRTGEPRSAPDQVADEYWTHDPDDMHDAHEQSKYDAEHAVNQRVAISQPVVALLPTMMYGPELRPVAGLADLRPGNRIVGLLAEHAAGRYRGLPGDGRQPWNLVHVEDVAQGHLLALDAEDPSGAWPPPRWRHWHYLLGGENVAAARLFEEFARLSGVAPPRTLGKGSALGRLFGGSGYGSRSRARFLMDSHSWAYGSDFAEQDFGYRARGLAEGLASTVAWMKGAGLLAGGRS